VLNQIQFELTNKQVENVSKFIIFAHHKVMMDAIEERIKTECQGEGMKIE